MSTTGLCSISTLVRIVHINDNERIRRHGRIPNLVAKMSIISGMQMTLLS